MLEQDDCRQLASQTQLFFYSGKEPFLPIKYEAG